MIEQTWLHDDDSRGMMSPVFLRGDRKQRLFALACARLVTLHLPAAELPDLAVLDMAERFADGEASQQQLHASHLAAAYVGVGAGMTLNRCATEWNAWAGAVSAGGVLVTYCGESAAADLLRRVAGNPFSPVREVLPRQGGMIMFDAWQGGIYHFPEQPALAMAEAAYKQRRQDDSLDPVLLSVLADVLEDHDLPAAMLQALRGPGPHYRGLWALDLILGKG